MTTASERVVPDPNEARDPRPTSPPEAAPPELDPADLLQRLTQRIGADVVGYDRIVRLMAIALIADGHILIEGVPGLAKTYLVRRFASALELSFKRIQFTPDMLPSDITGTVVLDAASRSFVFRPGPVFANVVLADEINRAPPKVQSALLEAMQERQVTIDGVTHPLPSPFIVIATENPVEQEGTYPLPESELDRLLFRALLDYPSEADELAILRRHGGSAPPTVAEPVLPAAILARCRARLLGVSAGDDILGYVNAVVRTTREDPRVLVGASPRAGVQFLRAAKASALLAGRAYVTPDDVKSLAFDVLNHRLVLSPEVLAQQYHASRAGFHAVLREIVDDRLRLLKVPR